MPTVDMGVSHHKLHLMSCHQAKIDVILVSCCRIETTLQGRIIFKGMVAGERGMASLHSQREYSGESKGGTLTVALLKISGNSSDAESDFEVLSSENQQRVDLFGQWVRAYI